MSRWMIYGATGYSGALIAREAVRRGMQPVLGGRNAVAVESLGKELGLEARVAFLDRARDFADALSGIDLVLNCAGPFSQTAEPMIRACIAARAHYLDITGEIDVFERARTFDTAAKAAGITICCGVGFDVIPTDCIASMLKEALPSATHLALGFDGSQTLSPGTAKTLVENLAAGGKIRRDGAIVSVPFGYGAREIDFGRGAVRAMAIPWGDISTAYATTGIDNIVVYIPSPPRQAVAMRVLNAVAFIFRSKAVVRLLGKRIEAAVRGPSEEERSSGETYVWGEARDERGTTQHLRLRTAHPYALTITGSLGVVTRLLEHECTRGTTTPARLMGSGYVLDLPGTRIAT